MTSLFFPTRFVYSGDAVIVPIRFIPPSGITFTQNAIVDSGAFTSFFNKAIAPQLGITDLTVGRATPVVAANGDDTTGYVFDVEVELLGRRMTIPVVFCPDWPEGTRNLLGMAGFFDQFPHLAFAHRLKHFYW